MSDRRQSGAAWLVRRLRLGRWVGVVLLVVGLIGVNVAVAQAGLSSPSLDAHDAAVAVVGQPEAGKRFGFRVTAGVLSVAADDDGDNDNEAEEEEFEEDGLLPTGQAEQRSQKKGEKAETKHEDAPSPSE